MSLLSTKLSDLPLHLQVRILTFLSPPILRSIKPSFKTANGLLGMIPNQLLDVANTSRGLRKAVKEVLAARAQVLNPDAVWPMWDWIPALNDSIKAVSLYTRSEYPISYAKLHGVERELRLCVTSVKIFRALSAPYIRLQVLDVSAVPFRLFGGVDGFAELVHTLKGALETSAASLRELAVSITPICIEAVSQVTLPSLEVVRLKVVEGDLETAKDLSGRSKDKTQSDFEFLYAMRALQGHADRGTNKTTLRELHLLNFDYVSCILNDNTCNGLFKAVQVLRISAWEKDMKADEFAKFVSLFPNLRSLVWKSVGTALDLSKIFASCPLLEELHPGYYDHSSLSDWVKSLSPNSHTFRDACLAYGGKLRRFYMYSPPLTTDQLQILGESCPDLERLQVRLNRENVAGLSCVLEKKCRSLKLLGIFLWPDDVDDGHDGHESYGILGTDGWRALSKAIRGASNQLCDISVYHNSNEEPNYRDMVQFALDVIEFLDDRAINFSLNALISTDRLDTVHELLCAIINKCVVHSQRLEKLFLSLVPRCEHIFLNIADGFLWSEKLAHEMKHLEKLPYLYTAEVGGRPTVMRDPLR